MKPWLQWTLIGVFAAGSAALGVWLRGEFDEARTPPAPAGLKVVALGGSAEPLLGTTHDGVNQPLPGDGRWRLINFWASWCPPCVEEMPVLDAYHRAQGPDGVQVIGIALEDAADARAFLDRVPVDFPVFAEPNSPRDSSVRLGNARGLLPYTVLIDPQGRLVAQHLSPFDRAEDIEAWVEDGQTAAISGQRAANP